MSEDLIICMSVESTAHPVLGSVKVPCSICGVEVWIAPSGLLLRERLNLDVACADCAERRASEEGKIEFMGIQPEQIIELEAIERRN